ncbi:hypothetical protein FisN_15Lh237 [Fistulifera solaris]|uniref:TsaA-like domain-containing protein n=1 Tax=Fistulifera solaris TaxID=1519565 RepID=A0A1Z5JBX5_FISSO|nr:hypothetical protein FisN_15Lh237 [Fistulifera solaris]|eukprot:GAX11308.1 hypothetical protein FisN_15Lh237 [Fistulifera solaris]
MTFRNKFPPLILLLGGASIATIAAAILRKKYRKTTTRRTVDDEIKNGKLVVESIGKIESIYRLCVGTPRQGLLAPHARGRLRLNYAHAVEGLSEYSYVWIVFVFHLNTPHKGVKIAPPALGGRKVGVLATRSPHRFNPVGITLARLDKIIIAENNSVSLELSGLDLVDGTPVLDIKPYVAAYDSPIDEVARVPSWVSGGLATKRPVELSDTARDSLRRILKEGKTKFYGRSFGESDDEGFEHLAACICEVLAMDVRSTYQTKKVREGKSQAERSKRVQIKVTEQSFACTQQIDNLLVHFSVQPASSVVRPTSEGSGAEDTVFVTKIEPL